MSLLEPNHHVAALCLSAMLLVACNAERTAPEAQARPQALSFALDGGAASTELEITPQYCTQDGTPPDNDFELRTLESFPEGDGSSEEQSLTAYTEECQRAIHFEFPDEMSCELGSEVPGQEKSCGAENIWGCDNPNVLNAACDPGSKFQRLELKPGSDPDAAAVLHCRKKGYEDGYYGDIAIIVANKTNGATCFFQALGKLDGRKIPSPIKGERAWRWYSPQQTANTGCTGCHDNGSFIRSRYIAQMPTMPNTRDGWANKEGPLRWVGKAFADKHSWSVHLEKPPCIDGTSRENCLSCTSCHRLAVNDYIKGDLSSGTALSFGRLATARYQYSKHAHSESSPIWMPPGQTTFDVAAHEAAQAYARCAAEFVSSGYDEGAQLSDGCSVKPLGGPWVDDTSARE